MKSVTIKNTCLNILLLFLVFACGESSSKQESSSAITPVKKQPISNSTFLYISNENNIQLAEIGLENNGNTKINTQNGTYFGEKKGDKLKYYDQQDNFTYEIKYKETSFKLRDRQSQLLWKVKLYDNKIKLSNNEEMDNPIEVKLKSDQKIVVYKNGNEDQTIRIDPSKNPLNISNRFFTNGFKNNYHAGILNISELNDAEKYFIIAELNR